MLHLTASGFVVSEDFKKALVVNHNIFKGYVYTGGHADGNIEKYSEVKGLDMAHFMPKYTFPEMETSDIKIIEYSEAGAGLGMCADYAFCNNVPLYLIAKTGSKISTTVNSVAEKVIFYEDIKNVTNEFKKLIETGELKTNPNTCIME